VLLGAGTDLGNVLLLCRIELLELSCLARMHGTHGLRPPRIERLQIRFEPCLELGDTRLMRGANMLLRGSQPGMQAGGHALRGLAHLFGMAGALGVNRDGQRADPRIRVFARRRRWRSRDARGRLLQR
jgi:hypothetical protein